MHLSKFRAIVFIVFLITLILHARASNRKVLFLGNSYTYVNNLPQLISNLAASVGDTLIFDSNTPGGYTLDQHNADTNSTNKIKAGGWDYVVMQEQSQLPSFQDYYSSGPGNLSWLINRYSPCARKMFYMTWGRKNGDASNCPVWPPVCTYSGMDSMLHMRYIEMAVLNNGQVSPVGAVWKYIRENYPLIDLYQTDESHPSEAGSYAAACCFYASLFEKDPTLSSFDYTLNANDASIIRNVAKIIVYDSLQNWNFSDHIPSAEFSYIISSGINNVQTYNRSVNADNYIWDFGDGFTSTDRSPIHSYVSDGTYIISLTAENCDLNQVNQSVFRDTVNFCSFNPTILPDSLILCPNSIDTLRTQSYDNYQWYDDYGNVIPGETHQYIVATGGMTYSVLATSNGCSEMSQQVYVSGIATMVIYYVDSISNSTRVDTICRGDTVKLILFYNKPDSPNTYQWFENGIPIPNAFDDTLVVTTSGDYVVRVFNPNCPQYILYEIDPISLNFLNCNIGIDENNLESKIQIYPNPSADFMNVKIAHALVGKEFTIKNILSETIVSGHLENEINTICIEKFTDGIYFLGVEGFNGEIKVVKITGR